MRKRLALILLALTGLVLGGYLWATRTTEPSHNGRTVSEWLDNLTTAPMVGASRDPALDAIRSMGKDAAPYLAEALIQKGPRLYRLYIAVARRLPLKLQRGLPEFPKFRMRRASAAHALSCLGTDAVDVLPLIVRASDSQTLYNSVQVLADCAAGTWFETDALSIIADRLPMQRPEHRALAYYSMRRFTNHQQVIAILIAGLGGTSGHAASAVLEEIGMPTVPALIEAAKQGQADSNPALLTLEKIDPEAAAQVKAALAYRWQPQRDQPQ